MTTVYRLVAATVSLVSAVAYAQRQSIDLDPDRLARAATTRPVENTFSYVPLEGQPHIELAFFKYTADGKKWPVAVGTFELLGRNPKFGWAYGGADVDATVLRIPVGGRDSRGPALPSESELTTRGFPITVSFRVPPRDARTHSRVELIVDDERLHVPMGTSSDGKQAVSGKVSGSAKNMVAVYLPPGAEWSRSREVPVTDDGSFLVPGAPGGELIIAKSRDMAVLYYVRKVPKEPISLPEAADLRFDQPGAVRFVLAVPQGLMPEAKRVGLLLYPSQDRGLPVAVTFVEHGKPESSVSLPKGKYWPAIVWGQGQRVVCNPIVVDHGGQTIELVMSPATTGTRSPEVAIPR